VHGQRGWFRSQVIQVITISDNRMNHGIQDPRAFVMQARIEIAEVCRSEHDLRDNQDLLQRFADGMEEHCPTQT